MLPPLPVPCVLLDGPRVAPEDGASPHGRSLLFTGPVAVLEARTGPEVLDLLAALDAHLAAGRYVAGYLAYEAGYAFEPTLFPDPDGALLAWFGVFDAPHEATPEEVERLLGDAGSYALTPPLFDADAASYADRIDRIRSAIHEGEVYQINYTAPFRFTFGGDPLGLYRALRRQQRVSYGALIRTGTTDILSLSPELFFRVHDGTITARPMKGTTPRGRDAAEDAALADHLVADPKSRAENLMIVDLLRNDLSRVAEPGSVHVPHLFTTEPYETLTQMTSTVTARLRPGVGLADLFRALFPCGSVTGAPKLRAMQHIRSLEATPRGVYCGALGYAGPDGTAAFNVPIRTVVLAEGEPGRRGAGEPESRQAGEPGTEHALRTTQHATRTTQQAPGHPLRLGVMGSGSGVVWDSEAESEYAECLLKAQFLARAGAFPPRPKGPAQRAYIAAAPAFDLLETMRAEAGAISLLPLHLVRLTHAAMYFDYPLDIGRVLETLHAALEGVDINIDAGPQRVRLTVDAHGEPGVTVQPAIDAPFQTVALYPEPIDPDDPFGWFKTTWRAVYAPALAWATAHGVDEALLVHPDGALVEGTRTSVWLRQGNTYVTPAVERGGLAGVHRQHLLTQRPATREAPLTVVDLQTADGVLLGNAVRGWQPVRLVDLT